jgi:hypothetical protein
MLFPIANQGRRQKKRLADINVHKSCLHSGSGTIGLFAGSAGRKAAQ